MIDSIVQQITRKTMHDKEIMLEEAFSKCGYTKDWVLNNPSKVLVNTQRLLNGTVDRYFIEGKHVFDLYTEPVPGDGTYEVKYEMSIKTY